MSDRPKIPVWATALAAIHLMARNWHSAIKVGWIPLVLWIGGNSLSGYVAEALEGDEIGRWGAFTFQAIFGVAVATALIVPWFRHLLSSVDRTSGKIGAYLHSAGWLALFSVSLTVISLTFDAASFLASPAEQVQPWVRLPVQVLEALVGFYFLARFGLLLPSLAVGNRISATQAWQISRGNGMRIALIFTVPLLVVAFFGGIAVSEIRAAFPAGYDQLAGLAAFTASSLIVLVEILFWATVLVVFSQSVDPSKASP